MLYLHLYRFISLLLYPIWLLLLKKRIKKGKEDEGRYLEKLAVILARRPKGNLIWFHAVSVGEINIIISLIKLYHKKFPADNFLITTTTVTSAEVFEKAKMPNSIHQYLPIDVPFIVEKFFKHWRPNLSIFTESEIWPNLLLTAKKHSPVLLINGRLSEQSFSKWKNIKSLMISLLKVYDLVLPGTSVDLKRFSFFCQDNIHYLGNLKNAAPPMPYNSSLLKKLKGSIGNRKVVVYASTHRGEEEIIVNVHEQLKQHYKDLLTIIVPRHIDRTAEILRMTARHKLNVSLYTDNNHIINSKDEIYIGNVVGVLGTFYRLAEIAFVGGSLVERGGHNILEPGKLGLAVLVGPHTFNFTEIVQGFLKEEAVIIASNQKELYERIKSLFNDNEYLKKVQKNALKVSKSQDEVMNLYIETINKFLIA
ncbi:MAG: 3-deoxy-D-manno-octulosonic acid transferase [Candidatus Midichloria sp.]|uniref:lipid IVA 3-deoxy-D-manno-octulosonic acid transferase n=1 Tax=Hyalomma marginatum TaxID=34627 RepID=A0A8S4C1R8_9ACAR|nr:3-deoxy-D-manno-octulosonic-acid transferase [Hyalomma marginatum]CAG7591912.1 3-deoxy-D-manno-octulosonic-acid transferase [Hyalomma marginatum]